LRLAFKKFVEIRTDPERSDPERSAPLRLAPERLANERSTFMRIALERFATNRLAPDKSAFVKSAPERFAFDRSAPVRMAFDRSTPLRLAFERFTSFRTTPLRSAFDRSIFRKFLSVRSQPLKLTDGPDSVTASHGAHCANDQELFWEYHDILYSNWTGENNGWASSENLAKFAQEIGLNMDEWSECMANKPHSQVILESNRDARTLEITGTPAFFVIGPDGNTTPIFGAQPFAVFENIFEIELRK